MLYYNDEIAYEQNNMMYSIDMMRLKTYITFEKWTEIEFVIKTFYGDKHKFYTTAKSRDFFYNYVIEIEEGISFWIGFLHNAEKRSQSDFKKYNMTIEFNPNKVKKNGLLMRILNVSGEWYLKSYDLAIDVKININDIIPDISGKSAYQLRMNSFNDKTIYIGKGNGRIKIYNKKIEAEMEGLGELTRIEQSIDADDFDISKVHFAKVPDKLPKIYLNKYLYSLSDYDDKTLFAILYAVQSGFPIKNLTYTYKQKIRNLFEGRFCH